MAIVGVFCDLCEQTIEVTIKGVKASELTTEMLNAVAKKVFDRHLPVHEADMFREIDNVLSGHPIGEEDSDGRHPGDS